MNTTYKIPGTLTVRFIKYEIGNDASYTKLTNEQECSYHYIRNSLSVQAKKSIVQ